MDNQNTLHGTATVSGIALHSGVRANVRLFPAAVDTGIVFRRIDLPGKPEVRALASNVVDVRRGTAIASGTAMVFTVEHIMSALHANKIDNAIIEMDNMEPPILDGSSRLFDAMIKEAGIAPQDAEAKYFSSGETLYYSQGETQVVLTPAEEFKIAYTSNFKGCPIDPQYFAFTVTPESYDEVKRARTFVDYADLKVLMGMGLCKGGSLDGASIIHDGAIICKEDLRYPNEIVRHKILDLIGDLYLCGCRVKGNVIAIKSGHPSNVALAGMMQQSMAKKPTA